MERQGTVGLGLPEREAVAARVQETLLGSGSDPGEPKDFRRFRE
jgi:hypothetical protein